jgi:hypothetical protein
MPLVDNQSMHNSEEEDEQRLINNVPLPLYKAIWNENQAFIRLKQFFDAEYLQFAREFVALYKASGNIASSLYFDKHQSQSKSMVRLAELREESSFADYQRALSLRDNVMDLKSGNEDLGLSVIKFATVMSFDVVLKWKDVTGFV